MKNILFYFILVLSLFSCKNNTSVVLQEEPINLYPNKELIKKKYYKYSLHNPFSTDDTLYTPIEPSKNNPKMARTLIKAVDPYDLQYFNRYIRDKMNGQYSDYVFKNDTIRYRFYTKHYKTNDLKKINSKEKIEDNFKNQSIKYKFLRFNEDKNLIYLLKKEGQSSPSFCVIDSHDNILEIHITYNVKDTIYHFPSKSLNPFRGMDIEN
ncbi:hypothetical protein [Chryseobacterium sp. 2R14A]|uniref:hypothetical protein n=1 Tax=Chryseobacterium sp. 2R14A TaxID=3380353 RepID=UPI003CFB7EA5